MTETRPPITRDILAEAGFTDAQIDLAHKTSADLRAVLNGLPEDDHGLRLSDIYEREIPS